MHYWVEQTKDDSFNPSNLTSFKELTNKQHYVLDSLTLSQYSF